MNAPDTLHHRLWVCPAADQQRQALGMDGVVQEALQAGPGNLLFSRGILLEPRGLPAPLALEVAIVQVKSQGQWQATTMQDALDNSVGEIFVDGSAYASVFQSGSRAGWVFATLNADSQVQYRGSVALPGRFRQTSGMAERAAVTTVPRKAPGRTVASDYAAEVSTLGASNWASQVRRGPPYAGMLRHLRATQHVGAWPVAKVKAHLTAAAAAADPSLARAAAGNAAADMAAKEGAKLHTAPAQPENDALPHSVNVLVQVFRCMAALLPLRPRADNQELAEAQRAPRARVMARARHVWHFARDCWRCSVCLRAARVKPGPGSRCKGAAPAMVDALATARGRGHNLQIAASAQLAFAFCARCGAYASKAPRGLAKPCPGQQSTAGSTVLRKVARGWHPVLPLPVDSIAPADVGLGAVHRAAPAVLPPPEAFFMLLDHGPVQQAADERDRLVQARLGALGRATRHFQGPVAWHHSVA